MDHPNSALVESPPDTNLVPVEQVDSHDEDHLPRLVAGLRRSTRAAEYDVQFLQRRVQKLKAEENHVWKKLETARQLKEKIDDTRARRQEEAEVRAAKRQQMLDVQSRERARLHDERDARRHSLFLARSKLAVDRRDRSARVRSESSELARKRGEYESAIAQQTALHHQLIVDMQHRALSSRAQRHESHQRNREQHQESEANILKERQDQHVKLAASLLTEEAQIIHRLQQIKRETTSVMSAVSTTPSPRKPPRPPANSSPEKGDWEQRRV